jgi:hypothetical protein
MNAITEECRNFRNETDEGANREALKKWDVWIKEELKKLDQFRY